MIFTAQGVETCMRIVLYFKKIEHNYVWGKNAVERMQESVFILYRSFYIEMSIHLGCVYPRICSTCSCDCSLIPEYKRQNLFNALLYAHCIGLTLPPVERRAIICKT